MPKRAQVTIFIILGLLLLLSVILVVYFTREAARAPVTRVPGVPDFAMPVHDYVTTCLYQVSREGLSIIALQGGYINLPGIIDKTPSSYVPNDNLGVMKTPLWYYEGEDRTPSIEYIETELAKYVKNRLPLCINDFVSFEQFDISYQEMVPIVTLAAEDVVVELKWPVRVSSVDRTADLESFVTDLPVRLREMWMLADKMMRAENRRQWFENLTIDLLSLDPEIPMNGLLFQCGTKQWRLSSLIERFRRILRYAIPRIRVAGTQYPPPLEGVGVYEGLKRDARKIRSDLAAGRDVKWPSAPPVDAFEFNRMMFDPGFARTDLKVGFESGSDLKFVGKPNEGGVMSSSVMKGAPEYLRFLCINAYHFTYDVIYPVKVMIRDDEAFNGEGFVFQMAFPVVVKNNLPARTYFGLRKFKDASIYPEFCNELGDDVVDIRAKGFVEGSPVAEELSGVNVTYQCLNVVCDLGRTFSDGSGHVRLYTYLPKGCSNPLIIAEKSGYIPARTWAEDGVTELSMTMLKKLRVVPRLYPYEGGVWNLNQVRSELTPTQQVILSVGIRDRPYDQVISVTNESTIELVYGDAAYDIDALLLQGDNVIGGYHVKNLTIPYSAFAGKDEMVLNLVEWRPYPYESEDQVAMFAFIQEGGLFDAEPYQYALRPVFR